MAGHPDDWTLAEGGSAAQQNLSVQLNRHLDRIKTAWYDVKGDPAAIETAITAASSTANDLKVEATKLKTTVELRLNDQNWFGGSAQTTRLELMTVHRGLVALAGVLQSAVGRLNVAEPQVRQAPLDVERIAKGFVGDANDLIVQAVAVEFLRQIQAEANGIVARWTATAVVDRQEQALAAVVTGFPRVPPPPPPTPEPRFSVGGVTATGNLATAATDLREQVRTLGGTATRYRATAELRPFTFGRTGSGRHLERLYDDFHRDLADRVRRFAERIDLQATIIGSLRADLDKADVDTAADFRRGRPQPPTAFG